MKKLLLLLASTLALVLGLAGTASADPEVPAPVAPTVTLTLDCAKIAGTIKCLQRPAGAVVAVTFTKGSAELDPETAKCTKDFSTVEQTLSLTTENSYVFFQLGNHELVCRVKDVNGLASNTASVTFSLVAPPTRTTAPPVTTTTTVPTTTSTTTAQPSSTSGPTGTEPLVTAAKVTSTSSKTVAVAAAAPAGPDLGRPGVASGGDVENLAETGPTQSPNLLLPSGIALLILGTMLVVGVRYRRLSSRDQ